MPAALTVSLPVSQAVYLFTAPCNTTLQQLVGEPMPYLSPRFWSRDSLISSQGLTTQTPCCVPGILPTMPCLRAFSPIASSQAPSVSAPFSKSPPQAHYRAFWHFLPPMQFCCRKVFSFPGRAVPDSTGVILLPHESPVQISSISAWGFLLQTCFPAFFQGGSVYQQTTSTPCL